MSMASSSARASHGVPTTLAVTVPASAGFDEWEAWQAKGAADDRAVRRKAAIAAPFAALVGAVLFYAFVIR